MNVDDRATQLVDEYATLHVKVFAEGDASGDAQRREIAIFFTLRSLGFSGLGDPRLRERRLSSLQSAATVA